MMSSLAIPGSSAAASAAASTTAGPTSGSAGGTSGITSSDFLQLLTAQLKYQSPSSPADPTQLASEFAAISEVNGINQLNSQVSNIQSSTTASQMAQAATLVGKQVAVAGNSISTNASGAADGTFNLGSAAQNVSVSLISPAGAVAGTLSLGALAAGQQNFNFTGGAANTGYSYQVNATDAAGSPVSVTPYSVYTVEGVNISGATPTLNVQGSATPLPVSSIATVLGVSTS